MKLKISTQNRKKFINMINYLIDSYYMNPNDKITVNVLKNNMEFDDDMLIKLFINDLKKKNLIIGHKKFKITLEGLYYLDNLTQKYQKDTVDNATFILALTTFGNTILSMFIYPYNIIFIMILDFSVIWLIYKAII